MTWCTSLFGTARVNAGTPIAISRLAMAAAEAAPRGDATVTLKLAPVETVGAIAPRVQGRTDNTGRGAHAQALAPATSTPSATMATRARCIMRVYDVYASTAGSSRGPTGRTGGRWSSCAIWS